MHDSQNDICRDCGRLRYTHNPETRTFVTDGWRLLPGYSRTFDVCRNPTEHGQGRWRHRFVGEYQQSGDQRHKDQMS